MGKTSIELGDVTLHNVKQLKRINQLVFPVAYNEKFYTDVLGLGPLVKLAYFNDVVVGAVGCRVETDNNRRRLYIMTLGCLASFRRLGIGSSMLNHVMEQAKANNCDGVYLHVQVNNDAALAFYEKAGFSIIEKKEQYYRRVEPADAFVLQKDLKEL